MIRILKRGGAVSKVKRVRYKLQHSHRVRHKRRRRRRQSGGFFPILGGVVASMIL